MSELCVTSWLAAKQSRKYFYQCAEHARYAHGMDLSPELAEKIRSAIFEEGEEEERVA
jgi:predicted small metal-binding protein